MKPNHINEFLSEYYSDNRTRKATVYADKYHYVVNLYQNGELKHTELITDHSLRYAEDLAENYVLYVGPFKDNTWTL